jgi:hypothetical protein
MPLPDELKTIPGAQDLWDWFGYWPAFHDAKILSLQLNHCGPSSLRIHTWTMTKRIDEKGYYVTDRHVVVDFILENISKLELTDFSVGSIIFGLTLDRADAGFLLGLDPCCGLAGEIEVKTISIRLTPGHPSVSINNA